MYVDVIKTIPQQPGSYTLWLQLLDTQDLIVGKLGSFSFPAGDYVYMGSAHGSGGLRARLGRHLRGYGKPQWHIDYLRVAAQVRGFGYVIYCGDSKYHVPTECNWSQKLAVIPKASVPTPRFGASDCRSGCAAHLIYFPNLHVDQIENLFNCEIRIQSIE